MKRHFTREEVHTLAHKGIEIIKGEDRRWTRTNTTIVKVDEKFYALTWEQGLTEQQENEYYEQDAPEVKKVETIITKTDTSWEPKD